MALWTSAYEQQKPSASVSTQEKADTLQFIDFLTAIMCSCPSLYVRPQSPSRQYTTDCAKQHSTSRVPSQRLKRWHWTDQLRWRGISLDLCHPSKIMQIINPLGDGKAHIRVKWKCRMCGLQVCSLNKKEETEVVLKADSQRYLWPLCSPPLLTGLHSLQPPRLFLYSKMPRIHCPRTGSLCKCLFFLSPRVICLFLLREVFSICFLWVSFMVLIMTSSLFLVVLNCVCVCVCVCGAGLPN